MPTPSNALTRVRRSGPASTAIRGVTAVVVLFALLFAATAAAQEGEGRIYVRRIELEGAANTADSALRDEVVQLEGALLRTPALDESVRRLRRLPFVDDVRAELRPVPGTRDVVDVVLHVDERAETRRYGGGGGWSASQRGSLRAYFADDNLLGTGRRLSFTAEASPLRSSIELAHVTPHIGSSEVARTIELSSRRVERLTDDASLVDAEITSVVIEHGYPLGGAGRAPLIAQPAGRRLVPEDGLLPRAELRERLAPLADTLDAASSTACCGSLRLGAALRRAELAPGSIVSTQLLDWITGHADAGSRGATAAIARLDEIDFLLTYRYDTRDRALFPTSGVEQRISFSASVPGSDVEYALADYRASGYRALGRRWTLRASGRLAYGRGYGDTASMPPYLHWFAGGPLTVRGFAESALGPRDSLGNPYGGNLLVAARLELMTAWPRRWREHVRVGMFADAGNVFSTENVAFTDTAGRPLDYGFDASKLKRSVGVAADVLTPFGALRLSYAEPLGADDAHPNPFLRDRIERFQISLGLEF